MTATEQGPLPGLAAACAWLDRQADWPPETAQGKVLECWEGLNILRLYERRGRAAGVSRADLAGHPGARARPGGRELNRRGHGFRAMRNPTSSMRNVGWLRRRTEARQLQCSSDQPPPRSTR